MAVDLTLFKRTYTAGGAITAFRAVKFSADKTVIQCDGATDKMIGVAQEAVTSAEATAGRGVSVCIFGLTKWEANAALTYGLSVGTSADGQAASYVGGTDNANYVNGIVEKGASAAAAYAEVLLQLPIYLTLDTNT